MIRLLKFAGGAALAAALLAAPTATFASVFIDVGISVNTAPPPLPVYVQPPCPQPDLIWTPGYWAYSNYGGYYWVPGAWVEAPEVGYLWTPGYWGYAGDAYAWHPGYWGQDVGFYGGVNYGYGYFGSGFYGGRWSGNHFRYNTAYMRVNRTVINNVYDNRTIVNNYNNRSRVSYNGGPHGVRAHENARQVAYRNETHVPETSFQRTHAQSFAQNRHYLASVNHGRPPESVARPAYARGAARTANTTTRADRPATARYHSASAYRSAATHVNAYHAPAHHTTAYHAAAYHAPAYHASAYHAPAYHASAYHAAAYHAPAYHASAYHAAAYHAPAYHASAYHAAAYHAPAYHAQAFHGGGGHPQGMAHVNQGGGQHQEDHRGR